MDAVDAAAAVVPPSDMFLGLPLAMIYCLEDIHCHVHQDLKTTSRKTSTFSI